MTGAMDETEVDKHTVIDVYCGTVEGSVYHKAAANTYRPRVGLASLCKLTSPSSSTNQI